jgi:hypothetical protein
MPPVYLPAPSTMIRSSAGCSRPKARGPGGCAVTSRLSCAMSRCATARWTWPALTGAWRESQHGSRPAPGRLGPSCPLCPATCGPSAVDSAAARGTCPLRAAPIRTRSHTGTLRSSAPTPARQGPGSALRCYGRGCEAATRGAARLPRILKAGERAGLPALRLPGHRHPGPGRRARDYHHVAALTWRAQHPSLLGSPGNQGTSGHPCEVRRRILFWRPNLVSLVRGDPGRYCGELASSRYWATEAGVSRAPASLVAGDRRPHQGR